MVIFIDVEKKVIEISLISLSLSVSTQKLANGKIYLLK